jgi:hypothetical protein
VSSEASRTNTTKKLWIGIGILLLLSPLGVIIPALFRSEGAWGEWGPEGIEKIVGFVPPGMKRIADIWKAPLPDYAVPGQSGGLVSEGLGYVVAGIVGVAATAGLMYLLAKMIARRNGAE